MYTIDVWELRGRIAARGYNVTSLSREIGVTRNTLAKYMGHPDMMPYDTMVKIISVLSLDKTQIMPIFFADKLTLNDRKTDETQIS